MDLPQDGLTHWQRLLHAPEPAGWALYLTRAQPKRLVVFVHGFLGDPLKSWKDFQGSGSRDLWWEEADMLFVGYDSVKDTIGLVSFALRTRLPEFYPAVRNDLARIGGFSFRRAETERYTELYLVGHSLGGVIVRHALSDIADQWVNDRAANPLERRPDLLDARLRLFSPASAGWQFAGTLGMLEATVLWRVLHPLACLSQNYKDLRPGSTVLVDTRNRTESLVSQLGNIEAEALRARILWAGSERIVICSRYNSDHLPVYQEGTTHTSVCKPDDGYVAPRTFVRTGAV